MSTKKNSGSLETILNFLKKEGWTLASEGKYFKKYRAPTSLNLSKDYLLNVPSKDLGKDSQELLAKTTQALASVYGISKTQTGRLSKEATIFSARLISADAEDGSLSLASFSRILRQVSQLLYKYAAYKSTGRHLWDAQPASAMLYLENCRFMQTERGSFIANLELPNDLILVSADLISPSLTSKEVTIGVEKLIDLIVKRALFGDQSLFNAETLVEFHDYLALQAAEEIGDLIKTSHQDEIVFSFVGEEGTKSYSTGKLDDVKFKNLEKYLDFLRDNLLIDETLTLTGHIVLLKSKDPAKDRNSVEINILAGATQYSEATVSLESDMYDQAIEAHHHNKIVRISGVFKPLRKSLKCLQLTEFKVLS